MKISVVVESELLLMNLTCPNCLTEIPTDAPEGICPKCLMGLGLTCEMGQIDERLGSIAKHSFVPPKPEELAEHFLDFEILELLGHGGMGAVYKARHLRHDRIVALKILPLEFATDAILSERFLREAQVMAKIFHPNIVLLFDFGEANGVPYLCMEFVDGINLRKAIHSKTLEPSQAITIVTQICEALQYAHDSGFVHRDIKPENILLDRTGRVKIADFGLVKLLGIEAADITLTGTNQAMGTPHYMAPEQTDCPNEADHRADIYALGVVFYELLTGELPRGRFAPPSSKVSVDSRLDDVVFKTLASDPISRYQRAGEVKSDLNRILQTTLHSHPQRSSITLAQVFHEGWRDWRSGGLTSIAKWSFFALYVGCFYQLINVTLTTDANGYVRHVGNWLTMRKDRNTGLQSQFHFDLDSCFFLLVGSLAFYFHWRVTKTESRSREPFRFPRAHLVLWISMVGYGFLVAADGVDRYQLLLPSWVNLIIAVLIGNILGAFWHYWFPANLQNSGKSIPKL